ncbi:ParM/StbA family protein [Culicoidibacter larvae]|uniref:ParM/StbA family protein n=1 Tax=Culicoidibacter larvae TaxID=2579976 RepID=A0A5R8Q7Y6_9FIRM|nr:ParM/StbA family protein [Culicoidibacter larvae]TLG71167.1 ParM/StbA family protein [Culicoidibacter larvae]
MKQIKIAAIDYGNGYFKRTYNGVDVLVDPSIYAQLPDNQFILDETQSVITVNKWSVIIGEQALNSGFPITTLVGTTDEEKYANPLYNELLFAFIAKDIGKDVCIEHLVLGVPVHHYANYAEPVKKLFHNKHKTIWIDNKEIKVSIKSVKVVPQPMGTFELLDAKASRLLIIDIGYGTTDVTEFMNQAPFQFYGENTGIRHVYLTLQTYLSETFPSLTLDPYKTAQYIQAGSLAYNGKTEKLDKTKINRAMDYHFNQLMELIKQKSGIAESDVIVFSGGAAEMFQPQIEQLKNKKIQLMDQAQVANVLGFYQIGERLV